MPSPIRIAPITTAALLLTFSVSAQEPGFQHRSGGDVHGVHFLDANTGWTCEDGGRIRHTRDGGSTWTYQVTPDSVRNALRGIFFLSDGVKGWACGDDGQVLGTQDGGSTWNLLTDGVNGQPVRTAAGKNGALLAVFFFDAQRGWVVGDKGILQKTSDGGRNWAFPAGCAFPPALLGADARDARDDVGANQIEFLDAQLGFVAAEHGWLLKTTDGGCSWSAIDLGAQLTPPLPPGENLELWDLDFVPGTHTGFVVGGVGNGRGYIFSTSDAGAAWSSESRHVLATTPVAATPRGVAAVAGSPRAISVGQAGQVLARAGADGVSPSWIESAADDNENEPHLLAVSAPDASNAWCVGTFNTVRKSTDGGATFVDLAGTDHHRLLGGDFVDDHTGCVIGQAYRIHRTTDGGRTWTQVNSSVENEKLMGRALRFNSSTGVNSGADERAVEGVAVGDPAASGREMVKYSTDAGSTWQDAEALPWNGTRWTCVGFERGADVVWAGGDGGRVMASLDGGRTWSARNGTRLRQLPASFAVEALAFDAPHHGYALGTSGGMRAAFVTADGGLQWVPMAFAGGSRLEVPRAAATNGAETWAVGDLGAVYQLIDGTWVRQALGLPSTISNHLRSVSLVPGTSTVYVGGARGIVLRRESGTWQSVKSQTDNDIVALSFQASSHGFEIGRNFLVCEYGETPGALPELSTSWNSGRKLDFADAR